LFFEYVLMNTKFTRLPAHPQSYPIIQRSSTVLSTKLVLAALVLILVLVLPVAALLLLMVTPEMSGIPTQTQFFK